MAFVDIWWRALISMVIVEVQSLLSRNSGNFFVLGCGDRTEGVEAIVQQLKDGLDVAVSSPSTNTVYQKFFRASTTPW